MLGGLAMLTKLEQEYTIRALDVDLKGVWRPSAVLTRMQEIAEDHAIAVGAGAQTLWTKKASPGCLRACTFK